MIGTVIDSEHPWRYCLVGNIVEQRLYGERKEIVRGTKVFSGGTKVYIDYAQWGDGYENVVVIGKPRRCRQLVQLVMPLKYIENFRCQKVYSPSVLRMIKKSKYKWWGNTEADREMAISLADSINSHMENSQMKE